MTTTFKYFSGTTEIKSPEQMKNNTFRACFPEVRGVKVDGYSMLVGIVNGEILPVERRIEYKARPSLHECNGKCLNGSPRGTCECKCGGVNHGRGGLFNAGPFKKAA